MADNFIVHHSPIHSIRRDIKSLKENSADAELLKTLIDSNIGTQHNISQVMSGLTELLSILKGVDNKPDPEIAKLEVKMNKILEQNYQLIQALNELTNY
ncbi:MAG: hypothetical protein QXH80_02430, partial [Candidatus Nanoarchaeia archaeon]